MDSYARTARLYPALLALLPLTAGVAIFYDWDGWTKSLLLVAGAAGVHLIVMRIVRDLGADRQEQLFAAWGGNPATLKLRWSNSLQKIDQADLHKRVSSFTGIQLPTEKEESDDLDVADATYELAVARLRERTRDRGSYPVVQAELANYGFSRNLYGVRPIGLLVAVGVTVVAAISGVTGVLEAVDIEHWKAITTGLIGLTACIGWIFWVNQSLVRREANRYASALLGAATAL